MCAIEAGKRGRRVGLLDHASKIGQKILISGGGRCNFTNRQVHAAAYVSENPHFCKSALSRFTPADFIRCVEEHGIAYREKKLGQLFCVHSAREIVNLLATECRKAGVTLHLSTEIQSLRKEEEHFTMMTRQGGFAATSLVVATGGLSLPKTGASDLGYRIAGQFGLKMVPTAPALDGFVFSKSLQKDLTGLAGISVSSQITCNGRSFRENILLTHHGLSGPAALQASLYWKPGLMIEIDLLPEHDIARHFLSKKRGGSRMEMATLLATFLPRNLAERLTGLHFPHKKAPLIGISDQALKDFAGILKNWRILPEGTVGYNKAEVTRGGVSTDELSSKTMESKKVPGLYFIGEVVDVTGWLGGYNFQWAWSSGWVAGQYV